MADIDSAKAISDRIREISWQMGSGGMLSRNVLAHVLNDAGLPDSFRSVAYWIASGGDTVFLQDANSIILSTDSLVAILEHIKTTLPQVKRITSYARGSTLKSKTVEDFVRLRDAGLTRLHVGMESGSDNVLKLIEKGCKAEQLIVGGRRVVEAGISLCLYIIPGIGGTQFSHEHSTETARVINAINPDFVRLRSLYVRRDTPLMDMVRAGTFQPPDEDAMVLEIRTIIERLDGISSTIVSDHILNLLEEVTGTLPGDKPAILSIINRYLEMPDDERLLFQLGRRGGAIRNLDDLKDPLVRKRLESAKKEIEKELPGGVPQYIEEIKKRFV